MTINLFEYNKFLNYKNKKLFLEGLSLENVANNFNTPLFCYSISEIEHNYKLLKNSFKKLKPVICYAMKANFNSEIIRILTALGCGIDVVSGGEMEKSIKNGADKKKIVFSGIGKTLSEIENAIKKNIKQINVESIEELNEINKLCSNLKKKVNICLRINPDVDAKTHEKISTGRSEDKFGISDEDILNVFKKYKDNKFINIIGLSMHIGSQIETLYPFKKAFKKLKKKVINLRRLGFKITSLDLGGGVGIKYNKSNKLIDMKSYASLIEETFYNFKSEIIIEPGRFLVGSSGLIISKIIRIKEGKNKKFLILDAGMNNLIRPALYGVTHDIFPVKLSKSSLKKTYDVVGPICESSDIFIKRFKTQKFEKNDLVAICSTGAYSSCMASDYNLRQKAKEIFIKKNKVKVSKN